MSAVAALAARLRRPADAWPGLARIGPEQVEVLEKAIDRAAARQAQDLEAALGHALTPWLAKILLARLRRRRA